MHRSRGPSEGAPPGKPPGGWCTLSGAPSRGERVGSSRASQNEATPSHDGAGYDALPSRRATLQCGAGAAHLHSPHDRAPPDGPTEGWRRGKPEEDPREDEALGLGVGEAQRVPHLHAAAGRW